MKKNLSKNKIIDLNLLRERINKFKKNKKKIVLCHGVFDLVHIGHIKHFESAKKNGDILVVTITADEYVDSLIKLCNVVKNFPKVKLTIKIRPQDYELTLDSLINLLNPIPNNVVIEYNKTFYEVLKDADLLISFSSTTIEEALVNKVPVLLFGGNGRYSHMPCKKYVSDDGINKAVTYIDSYKELLNYFQKLNSIEKNFNISDDEFSNYIFNKEEVANIKDFFLKNKF